GNLVKLAADSTRLPRHCVPRKDGGVFVRVTVFLRKRIRDLLCQALLMDQFRCPGGRGTGNSVATCRKERIL
ncbi:MAG: hypothetical protein KAJ06_01075, partial [Gammaproteobacteria bacterium]|nr:hypothetical protein [Gammaproteobacteria bacterium]